MTKLSFISMHTRIYLFNEVHYTQIEKYYHLNTSNCTYQKIDLNPISCSGAYKKIR